MADVSVHARPIALPAKSANAKHEAAYLWLRDAILTLQLRPGEPISDRLLAVQLGISRTPVRDVLHRLSAEGLVEIQPRRGAFVKDINISEVAALLQLREVNEGLAARLAAGAIAPITIETLRDRYQDILSGSRRLSFNELVDAGADLHDVILSRCANQRLGSFLRQLRAEIRRAQFFAWDAWRIGADTEEIQQRTTQEHLRIVDALASGDGAHAEHEMRNHIGNALDDLMRVFAQRGRAGRPYGGQP